MNPQTTALFDTINRLDFVAYFERLGFRPWKKLDDYVLYRPRRFCGRYSFLAIDLEQNVCIEVWWGTSPMYKHVDYAWQIKNRSARHMTALIFAHQYFRQDLKTIGLNREKFDLIGPTFSPPAKVPKRQRQDISVVLAAAGDQRQPVSKHSPAVAIPSTFLESSAGPW